MGSRKQHLIKTIVRICQKLDAKGYVANHDGNVSVRFGELFLATPTAESKSSINEDLIITLDHEGKKLEGIGKPFSEMKLHLAAYQSRPEAAAVVHAHPPFATARGLCGKDLEVLLPEAIVSIGHIIPCTTFAMPGDPLNDELVADALTKSDVFMMPGNGVLAIGADLEQAYLRIELLEHVSKIDFYARQMGEPMQLSEENLRTLLEKRAQLGLGPKSPNSQTFDMTPMPKIESYRSGTSKFSDSSHSKLGPNLDIKTMISEEIRKAIKGSL